MRNGDIDVALTYDLAIPDDLVFVPLVSLPPYVLFPEDHPLANLSQVTAKMLKDHPMVLLDLPLSSDYFLSFFRLSGLRPLIAERTRDMAVMRRFYGSCSALWCCTSRARLDHLHTAVRHLCVETRQYSKKHTQSTVK